MSKKTNIPEATNKRLVYGYVRVSTQKQADQGLSLEQQEEQIKRYFEFRLQPQGYQWGGMFRDAATSGKTPMLLRPSGGELSRAVEKGDVVVVAKLDRAFRNLR